MPLYPFKTFTYTRDRAATEKKKAVIEQERKEKGTTEYLHSDQYTVWHWEHSGNILLNSDMISSICEDHNEGTRCRKENTTCEYCWINLVGGAEPDAYCVHFTIDELATILRIAPKRRFTSRDGLVPSDLKPTGM